MSKYFIGVDVGTSSVRAGLVSSTGKVMKTASYPIDVYNPKLDFYLQSSENIWQMTVLAIREVCENIDKADIKGLGFDATCSLVILNTEGNPMLVNPDQNINEEPNLQNIILWMDHRASAEALFLNKCWSEIKDYNTRPVNPVSLEMHIAKILWLKLNMSKEWWNKVGSIIDLSDFLTFKATNHLYRSVCSLACKWLYQSTPNGNFWNEEFLKKADLTDLIYSSKINDKILNPGQAIDGGLCDQAAKELNLLSGTTVAVSIVDAHSGVLGMLGVSTEVIPFNIENKLGLICGTSTCHMRLSQQKVIVNGVWGPYYDVIVPGYYLSEGGQSTTGKLVDFIVENHPAYNEIMKKLNNKMLVQEYMHNILKEAANAKNYNNIAYLTKEMHIWPDFHGNRSPFNYSSLKGMISGLTLSKDEINLAIMYLETLQSLVMQTKMIMDAMEKSGHRKVEAIVICGGLGSNRIFQQIHADILQIPVLIPHEKESMILGAAMLAANASSFFPNMIETMSNMSCGSDTVLPNSDVKLQQFYKRKMAVFEEMIKNQFKYIELMENTLDFD